MDTTQSKLVVYLSTRHSGEVQEEYGFPMLSYCSRLTYMDKGDIKC
jgi:hypothetical protein